MKIGVTLSLFESLGIIPVQIIELKTFAKEAAVKGEDALRRQADITSRPPALSNVLIPEVMSRLSTRP